MERDSVSEYTNNSYVYTEKFIKGYNDVLSSNGAVKVSDEDVNYSNLESVGYYDGVKYGFECIRKYQEKDNSFENLTAVVEKAYSRAFDKYWEATSTTQVRK